MDVDRILSTFNRHGVEYLLIGGMNFLLRHGATLTFDVDLWIHDTEENRRRCEQALAELEAQWGPDDESWGPVARLSAGWLSRQPVYCLTSPSGAIDIFRRVLGLPDWDRCYERAPLEKTAGGVAYRGLSDLDMLLSQEALPEGERKSDRIAQLRRILGE